MNRDLDVGRFLAQYNHDPLGISQRHIVNAAQCSLRKGIRTTPPDNRLNFSQVVVRGLFFRDKILSNR